MKTCAFLLTLASLSLMSFSTGKEHSSNGTAQTEIDFTSTRSHPVLWPEFLNDTVVPGTKEMFGVLDDTSTTATHDFYITDVTVTPTTILAGGNVTVNYNHRYSGDWKSTQFFPGSPVYIYLSSNTSLGPEDSYLGSDQSSIGSDHTFQTHHTIVPIPEGTSGGTHYILVKADPGNQYNEDNEDNNLGYGFVSVVVPYVNPSTTDVYVEQTSGSSGTFTISSNTSWSIDITNDAPWMQVSPMSGTGNGTITLTATSANPYSYTRTAVLVVSAAGVEDKIVYGTQLPVGELEVSAVDVYLEQPSGSSNTFDIYTNINWSIAITNDAPWMQVVPMSGTGDATITLTATSANPYSYTRTAVLNISGPGVSDVIVYGTQVPVGQLNVSTLDIELDQNSGANATFEISANTFWNITDDAGWLSVSPTNGSNDATVSVTASSANTGPSPRTATITITAEGLADTHISVVQHAENFLTVSPATIELASSAGASDNISVGSNVSWDITDNAAWLTVNPASGSGPGTVTVTAGSANSGMDSRIATVTVSANGLPSQEVVVTQPPGPYLTLSAGEISLAQNSGSNGSVTVSSNVSWSITGTPNWLSVSPSSGTGNASVTFSASSENESANNRSVILMITGEGTSSGTLTVTQEGMAAFLDLSADNLQLGQRAGSVAVLEITSNTGWTASDNADWLLISPSVGNHNGVITLTAFTSNMENEIRSAIVTVTGTGLVSQNVIVQQEGLAAVPDLKYHSYSLNDGISGFSGDGDGMIERNEFVDLMIKLSNEGSASATGVSAVLSTAASAIQIIKSTASFDDISPGAEMECEDAFRIHITENATGKNYNMSLNISSNEGSFSGNFVVPVIVTSVQGDQSADWMSIYPNPASGQLTVKFRDPISEGKLVIMDITGRNVLQQTLDKLTRVITLDTGHLNKGTYLLQLVNDQRITTRKIVIR